MYFINTNWKHLQLLTVTLVTLEVHGTDIGSGTAHQLMCGQEVAAGSHGAAQTHTHVSCRPGPAPRCSGPVRPQGLPNSSLPGLRVSRCIQARIHREPGTGGACDLLHCQQMKVCCSLGAVGLWGCSHGLAGHKPEAPCLPGCRASHGSSCRAPRSSGSVTVPTAQRDRQSWAAPRRGRRAVPGGHCGSLLQTPPCLSQ